jgi:hypothetical protein
MTRRKPFTKADVAERSTWPESKAALRGHDSYDELGILNPTQRRQLIQLARVAPDREKPFIDEVICITNGYRRRKRCHAQESPAAVAESMRRMIDVVTAYMRDVLEMPRSVICELDPPLPTMDWFERAKEKLRKKELWMTCHRHQRVTEALIIHARALQTVASRYSEYLASDWVAMKQWLGEALVASGEDPPGKNSKKGYFEELMLPRATDGSVELTGRPPAVAALAE